MYGMTTTTKTPYNVYSVAVGTTHPGVLLHECEDYKAVLEAVAVYGKTFIIEPINAAWTPALTRFGCVQGWQVRDEQGDRIYLLGAAPAPVTTPLPNIPVAL